jgi:ABC-type dipeptide/oligopeptide/nickel transport system permease subunit
MPDKPQIAISLASRRFVVAPGQRLKIPVTLINKSIKSKDCKIKVEGVPELWISVPSQNIKIGPGEHLTLELFLQPERASLAKVEFYKIKILAIFEDGPEETISAEANVMVGTQTILDGLGILVASSNFSISPGEIANIPFFIINLGDNPEQLEFAIDGLPFDWVSLSECHFLLAPGERKRLLVSLHPPRLPQSRAGRHIFSAQFTRQALPDRPLVLRCALTVASFSDWSCRLDTEKFAAGRSAGVGLTNLGNIRQILNVDLEFDQSQLDFVPAQAKDLRLQPGETVTVKFAARVLHRRWFGGESEYPFGVHMRAPGHQSLTSTGQVLSRSRIPIALPGWMLTTPQRIGHWLSKVNWPLFIGSLIVLLMLILAVKGPDLAMQDPMKENYAFKINGQISRPPYPPFTIRGYPLGTDNFGRDLLSRILWGVRPTIILVMAVALVRLILGNLLGLWIGWSSGRMGKFLEGGLSAALSIPVLIVALMGITAVGIRQGMIAFIFGLALTGWAETARLVSTQTRIIKHQGYIEAARGLGASDFRNLVHHVWKQVTPMLGMLFAFEISSTLFVVAELGFLGYFIGGGTWIEISDFVVTNTQGAPELGQLLSSALVTLVRPMVLVIIGTVIFFGILGFNLLGAGLRIRSHRQTAGGGVFRRLAGERINAKFNQTYPLSVTDFMERHAVAVGTILAILLVSAGWLVWQNTRPVLATQRSESVVVVPGGQLWAAEKHDPQSSYWTSASGPVSSEVAWRYQASGAFSGGPVVQSDGTIIVSTQDQQLIALDPAGSVLWQKPLSIIPVKSPALGPGGEIYISGNDGSLLALSPAGEVLWHFVSEIPRQATSGPIVDSSGNIFYTLVDTIQAVTPDGSSKWAAYVSDVYADQPPVLSAGESYIFLIDKALAAENGIPLNLEGLPIEELLFTSPEFFVGADQSTYLRSGHAIYEWKITETGLKVEPGFTWPFDSYVVMPPVEQGVTPDGLAWMFYAGDYNDTRMVWLDDEGKLVGNSRLPDRQSRLIGVDRDLVAFICSNNLGGISRCEALPIGENEPAWVLELGENINVVGGALVPGRVYITTDTGELVALGSQ